MPILHTITGAFELNYYVIATPRCLKQVCTDLDGLEDGEGGVGAGVGVGWMGVGTGFKVHYEV